MIIVNFHRSVPMVDTPLACAAGVANVNILQSERLYENAEKVGSYLLEKLITLKDLQIVGDVRGKGLMLAVEFVQRQRGTS